MVVEKTDPLSSHAPGDRRKSVRRLLGGLLAVYWVALFISTHIPIPAGVLPPEVSDKTLHFVAYAGLAGLVGMWTWIIEPVTLRRGFLLLGLLAVYGGCDELLQIPVNRHADWFDWFADIAGATGGLILAAGANRLIGRWISA